MIGSNGTATAWGGLRTVVALACVGLTLVFSAPFEASAQERVERRSIINMLFGAPRRATSYPPAPPPPVQAVPRRQQQQRGRESRSARPRGSSPSVTAVPAAPAPEIAPKNEDASVILVIGDFMASGLAEGLEAAFADAPDVAVVRETNGSSGLVRDDYYDWPSALPEILERTEPEIVVVMIGSNDRQQISLSGESLAVRSEPWVAEYGRRVELIASLVAEQEASLVWVGAPAFQSPSLTADILAINDIYKDRIAKTGGEFVDIWDGFVDEAGAFVFTGSDIQGQQVRLRGSDGINMTRAGKRKIAFYAEKSIRRLLDEAETADGTLPLAGLGEASPLPEIEEKEPELVVRTPPIAITDPALDGGEMLLGAAEPPTGALISPREALVMDGLVAAAPNGRADDHRWPISARRDVPADEEAEEAAAPAEPMEETTGAAGQSDASRTITSIIEEAERAL